jgi:hypothetical protein
MKVKHTIAIALLMSMSFSLLAQENQNEYRTIFNKKENQKTDHGGYGAFGVGYTMIDGKNAILLNFRGAWVINHNIALGFSGSSFFNNLEKTQSSNEEFLGGGYGGFYIEPILFSNSPIHLTFPIIIGGGAISTIPQNYWDWDSGNYPYEYDAFFFVEPGVELELNMVKFFRIGVGASYRFTNGVILNYSDGGAVPTDALDAFNFYVNFKFGKF